MSSEYGATGRTSTPEFNATLADYEIIKPSVTRGASAVIHKARMRTGARDIVAIKEYGSEGAREGQSVFQSVAPSDEIFSIREATALHALSHGNIPRYYAAGCDKPGFLKALAGSSARRFIVIQFLDGKNLWLNGTPRGVRPKEIPRMPPPVCSRIVADIASALHHAHGRGIVHGDLSPRNVIVDSDGIPYLIDFERAWFLDREMTYLNRLPWGRGSKGYRSPQMEKMEETKLAQPSDDIYSLGKLLLDLYTGEQQRDFEAVFPRDWCMSPHDSLLAVARKCMSEDPRGRYATAGEVESELRKIQRRYT